MSTKNESGQNTITEALAALEFAEALAIGSKLDSIFSDDFICSCDESADCVCVSVDSDYLLFDA
jgi:hypothetical protein